MYSISNNRKRFVQSYFDVFDSDCLERLAPASIVGPTPNNFDFEVSVCTAVCRGSIDLATKRDSV